MYREHQYASVDGKLVVVNKLSGEPGFKTLSVEELWSIPLRHATPGLLPDSPIPVEDRHKYISVKPIQPVIEDNSKYLERQREFQKRFEAKAQESFYLYRATIAKHDAQSRSKFSTKFYGFRYWLHIKLLRWGVIV